MCSFAAFNEFDLTLYRRKRIWMIAFAKAIHDLWIMDYETKA